MAEVAEGRFTVRSGPIVDTPCRTWRGEDHRTVFAVEDGRPAHLSLADHGADDGDEIESGAVRPPSFPVRGIDPFGWVRYTGLTLTVERIDDLADADRTARRA